MNSSNPLSASAPVRAWLFGVWVMIFAMVLIGGITRLTGSGLSMVEWHPLMGALPPLNEAAWQEVWAKYQLSPQYQQVNGWMELADFKKIFFWEYFHRLIGRLMGVVFIVPWVWFVARKQLSRAVAWRSVVAFALGGAQGLLGWYMVQSGLVDEPAVSHYRLAAHLLLAFLVGAWVMWLWRATGPSDGPSDDSDVYLRLRRGVWVLLELVFIQSAWGAFMAGKHAGVVAPTFPDMNGGFAPPGLMDAQGGLWALVDDPLVIHFTHRMIAYLIAIIALAWAAEAWRRSKTAGRARAGLRRVSATVAALIVGQVTLGALVVVNLVPVTLAVAHQGVGFLLISVLVWALHETRPGLD